MSTVPPPATGDDAGRTPLWHPNTWQQDPSQPNASQQNPWQQDTSQGNPWQPTVGQSWDGDASGAPAPGLQAPGATPGIGQAPGAGPQDPPPPFHQQPVQPAPTHLSSAAPYQPTQPFPTPSGQYGYGVPPLPAGGAPQQPWGAQPTGGRQWLQHKPGIVPLRPLDLSDVLSGAIGLLRFNPRAVFGLTLGVELVVMALAVVVHALTRGTDASLIPTGDDPSGVLNASLSSMQSSLSLSFLQQIATLLLTGLIVWVAGEAVLGRRPSIGQAWHTSRPRLLRVVGAQLLLVVVGLVAAIVIVVVFIAVLAAATGTRATSRVLVLLPLLLVLAVVVAVIWLSIRILLVGPAIMLENLSIRAAYARSWSLTRDNWWRILGIQIVAGIITSVVGSAILIPLQSVFGGVLSGADATTATRAGTLAQVVGTCLAAMLTVPFSAGVTCLVYLDLRIRKEGFDLQLLSASDTGTSPWQVGVGPAGTSPAMRR